MSDATPAFLISVVGDENLSNEQQNVLSTQLTQVFQFLRHGGSHKVDSTKLANSLALSLVPDTSPETRKDRRQYSRSLAKWQGLGDSAKKKNVPIVLITHRAPGADQLAVDIANDPANSDLCICLRNPYEELAGFEKFAKGATPQEQGEFSAAYADLLIIAWNGERSSNSPRIEAAVKARLHGPSPDVLPTSQRGVRLPNGGPLLHLNTSGADLPPMRLLHPYAVAGKEDTSNPIVGASQRSELAIQSERIALLCRTSENLHSFVSGCPDFSHKELDKAWEKLLSYEVKPTKIFEEYADEIKAMRTIGETTSGPEGEFASSSRPVSNLRAKAASTSRKLKKIHTATLGWLFWLTFIAAVCLQVFSDWQAQDSQLDAHLWPRGIFGIFSVAVAVIALIVFAWRLSHQDGERAHDERALVEGSRVQFYWNLAGVGHSVPANYMQRQRSELDWIRAAIRGVAFPYEQWKERFMLLPMANQIRALEIVARCWIDAQRDYFEKNALDQQDRVRFCHRVGGVLALAGVGTLAVCIGNSCHVECFNAMSAAWLMLLKVAAIVWVVVVIGRWWFGDRDRASKIYKPSRAVSCVKWLIPTPIQHVTASRTWCRRFMRLIASLLARLPMALVMIAGTLWICRGLSSWTTTPSPVIWGVLFSGVMLVGGALMIAWSEKNLYSEQSYQYNTMFNLFRVASQRLEIEVEQLDALKNSPEVYKKKLAEIHDYLYYLGKEALDENAEWLLLHRARPLEPLMTG